VVEIEGVSSDVGHRGDVPGDRARGQYARSAICEGFSVAVILALHDVTAWP